MEANSTRFKRTIRRILDFRYAVRFYAKPANKNMGDMFSYSLVGRLIFILIKILVFLIAKDFYKFFVGKYDAYLWVGVIFVVAWIDSYFNIIVYEKGGRKQLIERAWKQKSRFKNRLILGCELFLSCLLLSALLYLDIRIINAYLLTM